MDPPTRQGQRFARDAGSLTWCSTSGRTDTSAPTWRSNCSRRERHRRLLAVRNLGRPEAAGTYSVPSDPDLFLSTRSQGSLQTWCKGPEERNQHGSEPNQSTEIQARSHLKEKSAGPHLNLCNEPQARGLLTWVVPVRCGPGWPHACAGFRGRRARDSLDNRGRVPGGPGARRRRVGAHDYRPRSSTSSARWPRQRAKSASWHRRWRAPRSASWRRRGRRPPDTMERGPVPGRRPDRAQDPHRAVRRASHLSLRPGSYDPQADPC